MKDQSLGTKTRYNKLNCFKNLLDSQVDMLLDTKSKVAVLGEVLAPELVLLDLEAALEDLLSLELRENYINEKNVGDK